METQKSRSPKNTHKKKHVNIESTCALKWRVTPYLLLIDSYYGGDFLLSIHASPGTFERFFLKEYISNGFHLFRLEDHVVRVQNFWLEIGTKDG